MATRYYSDWLRSFVDFASIGEAPDYMYFWVGVSTIAGALRRRVWIDMGHFEWVANFYIILVAPPGIVSKSTTASIGMNLLREVPGIKFGPEVVTWQALATAFAQSREDFPVGEQLQTQSALSIESSEFGNLLNPQDRDMVDLLVTLWDGRKGQMTKLTKTSGTDVIKNPWINIIACTTPAWIAGHFPEYMIGGGFTSRCLFVFAEEKARYEAYPALSLPPDFEEHKRKLIHDLEIISQLAGPFSLTKEAYDWGIWWYEDHYKNRPAHLDNERFGGYIARKQTHIHKTAMILSASCRDDRIIDMELLQKAATLVTGLEHDMPKVFDRIGKVVEARHSDEIVSYLAARRECDYQELFRQCFRIYPSVQQFDDAIRSLEAAGFLKRYQLPNGRSVIKWQSITDPTPAAPPAPAESILHQPLRGHAA
jgi:hypothetical protein